MKCPYCQHEVTAVLDSRETEDQAAIRRRRECEKCKKRFTTYERTDLADLIVIKKDDRREPFSREKLLKGLVIACGKLPISREQIETLADEVETELRGMEGIEVRSSKIGSIVMRKLKKIDKVAYIRFASVYRSFEDLEEFREELDKLISSKRKGEKEEE